ncbi:centrosomal protein of 78 kDa-like [Dendronephthya gigantea]|uniref:centrosomal protein of 78 kDa-like n=1 Tax=Dendronephthya gigantea TaxID=151771 RepID=UPI00106C029E|nr:centrosomal protein of 78 kDa-like [Dendronephthya gigantea]
MIETVRQRQRNAIDFKSCYENLCALQGSCPLSIVTANLADESVDCNADRIPLQDWNPIFNATRINKNLKVIALKSYWQEKINNGQPEFVSGMNLCRKKAPPIRSKDVTYKLCRSLKDCLSVTEQLEVLILQNVPLRTRDLNCLSKGLFRNKTLKHLSFENCQIGDNGFEVISLAIRSCYSLQSLNLTGCCLTWRGAETLAKLIKYQATKKHSLAWQDSLRYRVPDLDRMSGLRRITVCKNSLLGDRGVESLAEALKDDLWLKALDLQQCGISNRGALALQSLLRCNKSLAVLDLRINPLIERDLITSITQHVLVNAGRGETEYAWLGVQETSPSGSKLKKTKRRRSKTGATKTGVSKVKRSSISIKTTRGHGIPWRTAARVGTNRHKNNTRTWPFTGTQDRNTEGLKEKEEKTEAEKSELEEERPTSSLDKSQDDTPERIRQLEIEVEYLKHRLKEENHTRTVESEQLLELQLENRRLRREIEFLKAVGSVSDDQGSSRQPQVWGKRRISRTDLLDDNVLESIETSFKQFHAFLDMLNGAELKDLQTLLDQMRLEKAGSKHEVSNTGAYKGR